MAKKFDSKIRGYSEIEQIVYGAQWLDITDCRLCGDDYRSALGPPIDIAFISQLLQRLARGMSPHAETLLQIHLRRKFAFHWIATVSQIFHELGIQVGVT